jgi:hypothetical protein
MCIANVFNLHATTSGSNMEYYQFTINIVSSTTDRETFILILNKSVNADTIMEMKICIKV